MASVKLSDTLHYGIHPFVVYPKFHVDHFIDLTEENELAQYKCQKPITCFPIKDRKAPTFEKLCEIVEYIEGLEGVVYIYCKGGHGRSGTIAACVYGSENNLKGEQTLEHVNAEWKKQRDMEKLRPRIRKLGSPQTNVQKRMVRRFLDQKR
jgi:hypothetical protein